VSRQETPEQTPAERQGETKGEAVLVLENQVAGEVYIAWSRAAEPEAGQ